MSVKFVRTEILLAAAAATACVAALLFRAESPGERRPTSPPPAPRFEAEPDAATEVAQAEAVVEAAKAKVRQEAVSRGALEEAEVVRRAHGNETRRYLGCLMERGFMQPVGWQGGSPTFEREVKDRPLSLGRLRSLGALDSSREGQARLNSVVSNAGNDRSKWQFGHSLTWSADADYFVQHAQRLLIELGPTLVQEGLLAP